jgi:hypothetical protein
MTGVTFVPVLGLERHNTSQYSRNLIYPVLLEELAMSSVFGDVITLNQVERTVSSVELRS